MLILATALGLLIGLPQLWLTLMYYPKSIRANQSSQDKVKIGCVDIRALFLGLFRPDFRGRVNGVFYPEVCASIGPAILLIPWCTSWHQWLALAGFLLLSAGGTIFRLFSPVMLRIPARWMYWVNLTLVFMAVDGLYHAGVPPVFILLHAGYLVLVHSRLWPMHPFVQRIERPSRAFSKPYTTLFQEPWRVSGLSYPMRTGHVTHTRTLGYTGGAQLTSMARFRRDADPNGSGLHDWFQSDNTQEEANWFGVRWAITHRPLRAPWKPTQFRHVYENTQVADRVPNWSELEFFYGPN